MRSTAQSSFAALLLLIPILAVPMLAIFGVPDFAPLVESPLGAPADDAAATRSDAPPFSPAVTLPDEDFTPLPQGANSGVAAWPGQPAESRSEQEQLARLHRVRQVGFQQSGADEQSARSASTAAPTDPSPFVQVGDAGVSQSPQSAPARPVHFVSESTVSPPELTGGISPSSMPRARGFVDSVVPPARSSSGFTAPVTQTPPATAPLTWRAAVQRLNQMGISNFRLEPGRTADQFIFICSYTPRDNPSVSHRFEAEADEPLKAVEKVLAQIDDWLSSR